MAWRCPPTACPRAAHSYWAAQTSNPEPAARLLVSQATIKTPLLHTCEKLGVWDRAGAVWEAASAAC
jgi:ATP/maltotriose-dependent transcriptional regulator MalT